MLALVCSVLFSAPAADAGSLAPVAESAVLRRGEKLGGSPDVLFRELAAHPERYAGKKVTVEAGVRAACSKKGCWMELSEDGVATAVRVTFKDYGFFVPLDSAGSRAVVEGTVSVGTMSEAKREHLAAEGAKLVPGPDGKVTEIKVVATGVELRRAATK